MFIIQVIAVFILRGGNDLQTTVVDKCNCTCDLLGGGRMGRSCHARRFVSYRKIQRIPTTTKRLRLSQMRQLQMVVRQRFCRMPKLPRKVCQSRSTEGAKD